MNIKRCFIIIVPLLGIYAAIYFWLNGTYIFDIIRGLLAGFGIGWIAITIDDFIDIWQDNKQRMGRHHE
jgi:hypothetical protein